MGSWVTGVMSLLPATFQLPVPFRSRLGVRHETDRWTDRQTDRQTDNGHRRLMAPPYGGWGVIKKKTTRNMQCRCMHNLTRLKHRSIYKYGKTWFQQLTSWQFAH